MTALLHRADPGQPRPHPHPPTWTAGGFGPMTRIATTLGDMYAHALRQRDFVRTRSGVASEIVDVDRLKLDSAFLGGMPCAQPIRVRAGALGPGLPRADIVVSPGQVIGAGDDIGTAQFSRAGDLLGRRGVDQLEEEMIIYTVFRCTQPEYVRMEGIWAEIGG